MNSATGKVQQNMVERSHNDTTTPKLPVELSGSVLKGVLAQVERDEAEAIETLCAVLERVEESRDFSCLSRVREVLKDWQNCPPRGIVTDLMKIGEKLKCQAHDNT